MSTYITVEGLSGEASSPVHVAVRCRPGTIQFMFGAHLSRSTAVQDCATAGAEVIQVFVSNPRGYQSPDRKVIEVLQELGPVPVYAHLPYLVNPASADENVRSRSRALIEATDRTGAGILAGVVVHAGQGGPKATVSEAIERWVESLAGLQLTVPLLVENTAGGNAAPGRRGEDLIELVTKLRELGLPAGVCYDTCHAHAAGTVDLVAGFDALVSGLGGVDLVHLNDSRDELGSARDRHANLGAGQIGLDPLVTLAGHAYFSGVPVVLETPGDPTSWADELRILRNSVTK